jgi:cephalosporin hydroxylase
MKSSLPNVIPKRLRPLASRAIIDAFAMLYYRRMQQTWLNTRWLGVSILKNPLDLWVYQEIVHELRPDLIIETGTAHGGSALYLASLCDLVDQGRVITIDIETVERRPEHQRINYITGSSTDPTVVGPVIHEANASETVMVILDSDHTQAHVLDELRVYAPVVTVGSYLIVEDTNVNGHPVSRSHGPGPMEAVDEFMAEDSRFEVDATREKFMHTFNPGGYLRRTK